MSNRHITAVLALAATLACLSTARAEEPPAALTMELDEVVVTATRTPVSLADSPQSVEVVDRDDLDAAGGRLEVALDRLAGVGVSRTGSRFMAALPAIRGSQPGEVLVLLDGRRLNSQQSGWFNLGDLPLPAAFMERVEVLEDSSSALYGAEAIGGVINVITRDPMDMPSVGLDLAAGSLGRRGMDLSLSRDVGAGGFAASFGREYTDGWRDNSDAARSTYCLKASWPGVAWTLDLLAGQRRTDLGSPGPVAYPTPSARQSDSATVWGLAAGGALDGGLTLTADLFYNRYSREYRDPDWGTDSRHLTRAGGAALQAVLEESPAGRLTAGLEGVWDVLESTEDGDRSMDRQGIFLQDEFSPVDGLTLFATARLDRYSLFDEQFSPRLAVVWGSADVVTVRGSVARGYRTPTFDDLYWSDPYMRGNPELQPERSWNWELGTGGGTQSDGYDVNFFLRDVTDLIRWNDDDGDWVWAPENVASARISGYTVSLRRRLSDGISLEGGYQFVYPEDRDRDAVIPGRVRHQVKGALVLAGRLFDTRVDLAWIDRYDDPALSEPSYWTSSLRFSRTVGQAGERTVTFSLWLDNVLDEEYEVTAGYPMPGREVGFLASWTF